jgi:PPOX class probable F420-dependent enzyme
MSSIRQAIARVQQMNDGLKNARYLNLGTFRSTGVQVNTPVWFAEDQGTYFIFSARDTGKVKRIRNSGRSRVAPCDVKGNLSGDWLDTECALANPEQESLAYKMLKNKYGWQMGVTNFFSRLTGKINHRVVLVVTLSSTETP